VSVILDWCIQLLSLVVCKSHSGDFTSRPESLKEYCMPLVVYWFGLGPAIERLNAYKEIVQKCSHNITAVHEVILYD
jgi:hypothetical protein